MRHIVAGAVCLALSIAAGASAAAPPAVVATGPPSFAEVQAAAPRDTRRGVLKPKAQTLLITENANIERLYRATPLKDPDRPRLLRRLAEGYVELAASAERDAAEADAKRAAAVGPRRADLHRRQAIKSRKVVKAARDKARSSYRQLRKLHPTFCSYPKNPPGKRGCGDEVTYYLALAAERAGELDKARQAYLDLVKTWPKSRFIPHAYYAFGALFLAESQNDPAKWPITQKFFEEVVKHPPPDNPLFGFALYLLARCHDAQGQHHRALEALHKVEGYANRYPQLRYATELGQAAATDASALRTGQPLSP